jgi:hypothetical protein
VQELTDAFDATKRTYSRAGRRVAASYDDADFYLLTPDDLAWYRTHATLVKPALRAGDLLLWSSAVVHSAGPTHGAAGAVDRVGTYVSMMPREILPPDVQYERRRLARTGLTSSHNVAAPTLFGAKAARVPLPAYSAQVAAVRRRLI